jgi:hypothetical protein
VLLFVCLLIYLLLVCLHRRYVGVLGVVLAVLHSQVPDENTPVDPPKKLSAVERKIEFYEWKDRNLSGNGGVAGRTERFVWVTQLFLNLCCCVWLSNWCL